MFDRAAEIKEAKVKVGVLSDDNKGGMHHPGSSLTVAEIAAILNWGTEDGRIPPRPVLEPAFDKHLEELSRMGREMMEKVLLGEMALDRALNIMGAFLTNACKRLITDGEGVPPPNAPSTIRQKGSERTWVDTGRVLNAFTWSIEQRTK